MNRLAKAAVYILLGLVLYVALVVSCNAEAASEPRPLPRPTPAVTVDEQDAIYIAKTLWGECRGVESKAEQAAVAWCILNRVDAEGYACGRSVKYVVTFPNQFTGYRASNPVTPELYDLAVDVLTRWQLEKVGVEDVGRVLPEEYLFFVGDGQRNHFRDAYRGGNRWDWSLPDPYTT